MPPVWRKRNDTTWAGRCDTFERVRSGAALLAAIMIAGCIPPPNRAGRGWANEDAQFETPAATIEGLRPAEAVGREVVCSAPCAVEWERALSWLSEYAAAGVVHEHTGTVIVAGGDAPILAGGKPSGSRRLTASRLPVGTGTEYTILLAQECAAPNRFRCRPPTDREVEIAFLWYVKTGDDLVRGLGFSP